MSLDVEVRNVSRRYPTKKGGSLAVLDHVDLEVASGEFVSLVGPSGCGKTTLLRMMAGLLACPQGRIILRGHPVRSVPDDIGFVFQEAALLPWRSVYDNIALALAAKDWTPADRKRAVEEALDMTGLSDFSRAAPYELSGGMQRRVGVARAVVGRPKVLFMDEPFVALDALTRSRLQGDLATLLAQLKTTVVFVTHDVGEAAFLSDRIVVFSPRPGRILEIIDVDLDRPRDVVQMRTDPKAGKLQGRVLELIEGYRAVEEVAP